MKKLSTLLFCAFSILLITIPMSAQHSIVGDDEACYGECKTYNLNGGTGGPYWWKSTGDIEGTNQGSTVEICWNTHGSNTISLVDFSAAIGDQLETIDVTVAQIPTPIMIPPVFPICSRKDSLDGSTGEQDFQVVECISACSASIGYYTFAENDGADVEWRIEGGTVLSTDSDGITIQWPATGNGSIVMVETNDIGCKDSIYVCVDILEDLEVEINEVSGNVNSINVCAGQDVYLEASGTQEATNFDWHLGNGSFASGSQVSVSYDQGGTYEVMLIGSSECKCFDTTFYEIIVDQNPGPEITCIGTTCGNEDHTYYAANTCGSYTWNVSGNGNVMDGGGNTDNFVTVNWNSGPVGTVGLSTSGCAEALCASETVVQIPIIDGSATIQGDTEVCKSGFSKYTIQNYNGTDYTWSIAGNGFIASGWGTNEIVVEWEDTPWSDNAATILVEYENCYLECGGQATLDVLLKPEFTVSHAEVICDNQQVYISAYEGWNSAIISWEITAPSGAVTTHSDVGWFQELFTEIGRYSVRAYDNNNTYCNDEIISSFEVIAAPSIPTGIEGPMVICLNEYYNYSVPLPGPGVTVRWAIIDGNSYQSFNAPTVTVQWTSNGPYEIRVFYQMDVTNCRSEELIVFAEQTQTSSITGSSSTCVDEIETYSIGATNGTTPEWTIVPSDAGSIIHNPDNTIDVMWHSPGNHQIESDYCGANLVYNVEVFGLGTNAITYDEEICPGELAMINGAIPVGSTIEVVDEMGNVVGNSTNVTVPDGIYEVIVTSTDGCIEVIPIVIDTFLPPSVRVSSPDENAYCLPHPNLDIVALNTNDGYTYEWFHNNVSMGITTPSISTNVYGGYYVQVTDMNGCTAISNTHRLYEWCEGDPPPGTCTGGGSGPLNPDELYLRCNNLQFTVNGTGISSTSFTWQFGDPDSGADNFSNETSPIHEFSSAGYFYVFVQGNVPGEESVDIFTVPAAPRFDYERACVGNDVQFRNHSTFIPGFTITNYTWNFGDPSSGAANTSTLENPTHNYASPGTYNVTLDIESDNGCISTYTVEVEVEAGPIAEFFVPFSACEDEGLYFEAFQDEEIYSYSWDFDDPTSGDGNTSSSPIAIHTFSGSGVYNVSLVVEDGKGCTSTITKPITVSSPALSGEITADMTFPICYGESVMLSAPSGGDTYIWSDGSLGQSISVSDPGLYSVTISDGTGCNYTPDPVNVVVEGIITSKITATHLTSEFFGDSYFDSLVICQGERFTLSVPWMSGATYLWSNGNDDTNLNEYETGGLSPGRHIYTVTITEPSNGCEIELEPMEVIIHPLPAFTSISSNSPTLCEGEVHTLTIDNPDPNILYYWNNGDTGTETQVSAAGNYYATMINRNGCEYNTGSIFVAALPDANRINVGCTEACFPDTICLPFINNAFSYQWLLDGSPIGTNSITSEFIIDQAGDYQLIVENYNGCSDTSDILSIQALPSNQSVSGLVFIDDNNNGIWDNGEELLGGVSVNLYMGNTLVETIVTDANGSYLFDPVSVTNPRIEIDTTGLGLNLTGGLYEENIDFIACDEDKLQDFPLIRDCTPENITTSLFTCLGEVIIVNNIVLQEGDTWTFDDMNQAGCDSSTFVTVFAFPEADVNLTTTASCLNANSGVLDITIMAGNGLQFAVDNNSSFTTNLQFTGLGPGMHTLFITDENNCSKSYDFEILPASLPSMNMVVQNTCINSNTGTVEIIPTGPGNYQYSLDGITFSTANIFTDLGAGNHIIYVMDGSSCMFEYPINVVANPQPQFDLTTDKSCSSGASGTLDVTPSGSGSFMYSLDNINFTTNPIFTDLPPGNGILYVQEMDGCVHEYSYLIDANEAPQINLATMNTCEGENEGSILISELTSGNYEYSLDGINYTTNLEFNGLGEGTYTVYLLEDGICDMQFSTVIATQPEPVIFLTVEDACVGEVNGALSISTSELGLSFSMDQSTFSNDSTILDLGAGVYTLYVQSTEGCLHPMDFEILESEALEVEFEEPVLDCTVREVNLSPTVLNSLGEVSYLWSDGSFDSTLQVENSGSFAVSVTDKCSIKEYNWDIQIEEINEDQPIYFPNIFSPNQDGVNECFVPTLNPKTTLLDYHLLIYDRWGNKYFETHDINQCWDGMYNGREVRSGVFVYLLEMDYTYCTEVESVQKAGDVTVVH